MPVIRISPSRLVRRRAGLCATPALIIGSGYSRHVGVHCRDGLIIAVVGVARGGAGRQDVSAVMGSLSLYVNLWIWLCARLR